MSNTKKYILTIIFAILIFVLCVPSNVFATQYEGSVGDAFELGDNVKLSEHDMIAADNIYCIAHSKGFGNLRGDSPMDYRFDFKAKAYVHIKGKHAEGITVSGNELVRESEENAILAAILGGALEQGYGYYVSAGNPHYNEAQRALYAYWNKWVNSVGGQYGFQRDSANDSINDNGLIQKAKNAASVKDYEVTVYLLQAVGDDASYNPQELIAVKVENEPDTPDEPVPGQTTVPGYINISGYVWEDIANSKNNTINSKYDSSETDDASGNDIRLEGIKVHWKANDGSEIASATTGKDGSYKLQTTIDLYNHPYGIKDKEKYDKINNSYIEFEYNGLKYTTVAYNGNLSNSDTSKGKESETSRTAVDNKFDRVENRAVYDGNTAIISGLPNTQITDANYAEEFAVSALTKNIVSKLLNTTETNGWTEKTTFCTDHCQPGEGPHVIYKETYGNSYIKIYCNGQIEIHDTEGHWTDEYKLSMTNKKDQIVGDAINTATGSESHYYSAGEIDGPTNRDCRKGEEKPYVWNIQNMNLGLVRREQPDAAITSDIEKVRVIMKNQEYTYIYGNRGIQDNEELFDYKVKFGNKYVEQQYSRPVNPADIAYVNYNNSDDLKVYVTYNIVLKNQSNTLPMTINNIVNYYDSNYTIYKGEGTSTSGGWQESNETNNGYKIAYNTSLNNIQLQPGEKSEVIKIEFEVNQDRIKGLLNEDATLYNVSEIFSFTTYYGENTICAERETAAVKGKTGKQYAGLDIDSTPGTATPGNVDTYEDDTDKAPSFLLMKNQEQNPPTDPENPPTYIYKTMSGTVYEDMQTAESKNSNERLGNGQKEGNEKGVANVKVELLDAETGEVAYLYYKDNSESAVNGANRKPAVTYTDANGNYSFGDGKTYGVVVDNYIIKYTYGNADKGVDGNGTIIGNTTIDGGNTFINARNYKSTIITESNIKSAMQGNNSEQWHLVMSEDVDTSIAVDDLKERLSIGTLKYNNYENAVNMSAYSKPFEVQVEYTPEQITKVDDNGGEFPEDWSVFDFGIVERPREDIVINKTISKIKVTLSNGQVLVEGDPNKDNMNYVKAIGFKTNTDANGRQVAEFSEIDRMLTIEMDSELIQGAKLEIWYSITVTNNSEIDYEYEKDYTDIIRSQDGTTAQKLNYITTDAQANYYYYGNKNGLTIIIDSVETVADYMNSKLDCNVGKDYTQNLEGVNNAEWFRYDNGGTAIDANYLKDNGYISYKNNNEDQDKTYETIQDRKLQTIVTKTFADLAPGDSKTSVIYANTILVNQEDDAIYDNHVEILEINGKIARTINSVKDDTREQVAKTYQPGNYIPTLSSDHQQDDDRVRVVVTPPTGIAIYTTTYIISAVVGLIVIVGGIVLIKKKIIKK